MSATAIGKQIGGAALITATGGTTRLRADKRLWLVTCTTAAQSLALPPALISTTPVFPGRTGHTFTLLMKSTNSQNVALKDSAGDTITGAGAMAAGEVWDVTLRSAATAVGSWKAKRRATAYAEGATIPSNRESWAVDLNDWSSVQFNLRDHLDSLGYEGVNPVAVRLTIGQGVFRGSDSTAFPAVDTGTFPAGSWLVLINRGTISGAAGYGGLGGYVAGGPTGGLPGAPGGPGLTIRMDHVISNYGTIQGGGGGGGGGANSGQNGGGGGGGGAGYRWGIGGQPGGSGATGAAAVRGSNGVVFGGGAGGASGTNAGGAGGAPGTAGSAGAGGGGSGGAKGFAIQVASGFDPANILVAGTVTGGEEVI